ncbi:MAG: hypothetical protein H6708_02600 [Kofleriaceae bacterium]|nr:hypothetical protein [Kofleriaceae bacterium]
MTAASPPSVREAVRLRPGMYIGDTTDGSGQHHMLWEVIANVIDDHLRSGATRATVTLEGPACTVEDDGRGIPVDPDPEAPGRSLLERVMTEHHTTGTAFGDSPHVHVAPGLFGVGLCVVAALSSTCEVEVARGGRRWHVAYRRGEALGPLRDLGPTTATGTRLRFEPDAEIFAPRLPWDVAAIAARLTELAALNPGMIFELVADGARRTMCSPRGLLDLVLADAAGAEIAGEPVQLRGSLDDVDVEVVLAWTDGPARLRGFVSQFAATQGTHVAGLMRGLADAVQQVAPGDVSATRLAGADALPRGLVAAVHVALYHPRWGEPTKDRLDSPEAGQAVAAVVGAGLAERLRADPALREIVLAASRA